MSSSTFFSTRRIVGALAIAFGIVLLISLYYAFSGWQAYSELTSARNDLVSARRSIAGSRLDQARTDIEDASASADKAAKRLNGPLWKMAAAVPVFGDTPQTAAAVATSLDQALTALQPLTDSLYALDPSSLVNDGQIDVQAVEQAGPALQEALPGVDQAVETMQTAPLDGAVVDQVRTAATQYSQTLDGLQSTLATASIFGQVAAPLLGADGEKHYFVGILNPNEARGTGGFLGNYAILSAADGKVSVGDIYSNDQLPNLSKLPSGLDEQFRARYGDDPMLRGNMNLSPNFPDTAKIWMEAWKKQTGQTLDGAIAVDAVALGNLVQSSGRKVSLPDGGQLTGKQLTDFSIRGLYEKFPERTQTQQRKDYSKQTTQAALDIVTAVPKPVQMARALGAAVSSNRMVVYSTDPGVEQVLASADVTGTLRVPDGPEVQVVALNASGSKLDAFLSRSVDYEVGRCTAQDGTVTSQLTVDLRSDVPLGDRPPAYMMGQAQMGPTGPVNVVILQAHLPNGAQVKKVTMNGKKIEGWTQFEEQGRPAIALTQTLPPREKQELVIEFTEPQSDRPGRVVEQPLAFDQQTTVSDLGC